MRPSLLLLGVLLASLGWLEAGEGDGAVNLYVGGYGNEIRSYRFQPADGGLTPVAVTAAPANPTFIVLAPAGDRLYAVSECDAGRIVAFAVDAAGGLRQLGDASSGGHGPCHVSVDASGRWVFAANYGSGDVAVLPVIEGGVGAPTASDRAGAKAHMALPSPDGTRLLVPCLGSDHVAVYRFAAETGALTRDPAATLATAAGAGPRHLAFHPSLAMAYLIAEYGDTLTSLAWDPEAGRLTQRGLAPTLPAAADAAANSCAHIAVHPSGRFAYGSNRGHDSIAVFGLDRDGVASPAGHVTGEGAIRTPRHFALDAGGRWMVVANQDGGDLAVFAVDPVTGALALRHRVACPGAPTCVVFSR